PPPPDPRGNLKERLGRRGRLRAGGGGDVLERRRRLLHGVRQRARRRLRAAALPAEGKEGRAWAGFFEDWLPRNGGVTEKAHRRSDEVRSTGRPVPVAAVRLLEHAPRQPA